MLRLNLFTYRDPLRWLENPFGTPPLIPASEQLRADATLTDISESESDHYEMLLRSPSAILYCLQPLQTQIRAQHQPASPRFRLLCYSSD
jgi:hypothetical protein